MPNWKKVITSGSNAALNNITASRLTLESSGSTIFDVVGSQGQLFSITDSLSGSLFAVKDISGLPILEVLSDDTVKIGSFNNEAIIVSGSNATITGSFTGSFTGDGSNLTNLPSSDPFPYTGSAIISGSLEVEGDITGSGKINLDNGNGTIIIGNGAGTNVTTAANNVIIGNNAADIMTVSPNNVIIGAEAGPRYTTGYGSHVMIGYLAGRGADQNNDDKCVIIGTQAGYQDVGFRTVAIGHGAAHSSNASSTVSLGYQAHRNVGSNASHQIAIGYEAGYQAQGADSIFIGKNSGRTAAGTDTQALGTSAAYDADGNYNVAIGTNAAYNVNGDNNIAIGYQSLRNASGIIYNNTIALGHEAGYAVSGSDNILLGYQAGYNLTGSNQLIIANNSSSALVTGDFENNTFNISGSVSASTYYGDGSNLTGISSDPFPYTGSAIISGSLDVTGSISVTGNITTNTISTISTLLASDSATNVDTFATATYTGAIYDYTLVDTTVGARAGQFMVAQDNGSITFTDTSTKHLFDPTIPEITAQINGSNVEVQVTNGDGYTFKSFTKKL